MADGMDGLISSVVRMSSGEITSMLGEKNGGLDDSAVMQRDSVGDGIENPLGASFGTALAPLDDAVDLGGLRLLITKHTIHREDSVGHVGSANHSYVVSRRSGSGSKGVVLARDRADPAGGRPGADGGGQHARPVGVRRVRERRPRQLARRVGAAAPRPARGAGDPRRGAVQAQDGLVDAVAEAQQPEVPDLRPPERPRHARHPPPPHDPLDTDGVDDEIVPQAAGRGRRRRRRRPRRRRRRVGGGLFRARSSRRSSGSTSASTRSGTSASFSH